MSTISVAGERHAAAERPRSRERNFSLLLLLQINSISSPDARAFCLGNLLLMYVLRTRQAGMQSCGMLPASWMVVSGLQCLPTNSTVASWTDRGTTGANHGFRLQAQNVVLHCHCRSWFASEELAVCPSGVVRTVPAIPTVPVGDYSLWVWLKSLDGGVSPRKILRIDPSGGD